MIALELEAPRTFRVVERERPSASQQTPQIVVRFISATICGSDLPKYAGTDPSRYTYPLPVGMPIHECVGEVVESSAENFEPGDYVIGMPVGDCGLSDYFVTTADRCVCLPDWARDYDAAPIIQPLACVLHGIDALGDVSGTRIVVVGCGGIGCLLIDQLHHRGSEVIAIDPVTARASMAADLGASNIFNCHAGEVAHDIAKIQPDICIEAVGHQQGTVNECIGMVRKYGTVLAFGVPDDVRYTIDYELFFRKNMALKSAVTPPWLEYMNRAVEHLEHSESRDRLARLVNASVVLDDAKDAYETAMRPSKQIKMLIKANQ